MKLFKYPRDREELQDLVKRTEYAPLLVPSPREALIEEVCGQAVRYGFAGVLATPFDCAAVEKKLSGTGVETICLNSLNHALDENFENRLFGTDAILEMGIRHIELPVCISYIRDQKYDVKEKETAALTEKIHEAGGKASVIVEPDCMSRDAMKAVIRIAEDVGADAVRIGSGFEKVCGTNGGRATVQMVCFVREQLTKPLLIKAGGGWDYAYLEDCAEYVKDGAGRFDAGMRFAQQLAEIGYGKEAEFVNGCEPPAAEHACYKFASVNSKSRCKTSVRKEA